jgi:hypothetical protein
MQIPSHILSFRFWLIIAALFSLHCGKKDLPKDKGSRTTQDSVAMAPPDTVGIPVPFDTLNPSHIADYFLLLPDAILKGENFSGSLSERAAIYRTLGLDIRALIHMNAQWSLDSIDLDKGYMRFSSIGTDPVETYELSSFKPHDNTLFMLINRQIRENACLRSRLRIAQKTAAGWRELTQQVLPRIRLEEFLDEFYDSDRLSYVENHDPYLNYLLPLTENSLFVVPSDCYGSMPVDSSQNFRNYFKYDSLEFVWYGSRFRKTAKSLRTDLRSRIPNATPR